MPSSQLVAASSELLQDTEARDRVTRYNYLLLVNFDQVVHKQMVRSGNTRENTNDFN